MSQSQATKKPAKDRLMAAAMVLFYNHGISGTGIDAIVERAGVAKKSLYNNFESKADLVRQYLEARHAEWLALYDKRAQMATTPQQGVLAVFDAYQDHAECAYERGFRGCGLLNAAAELEVGDIGRDAVRHHKECIEAILMKHLLALHPDTERAARTAAHLAFLLEGSIVRAGLEGNSVRVIAARELAQDIVETF